nr:MAG TPA: hypothetical protein [Inoviridae sp.]
MICYNVITTKHDNNHLAFLLYHLFWLLSTLGGFFHG